MKNENKKKTGVFDLIAYRLITIVFSFIGLIPIKNAENLSFWLGRLWFRLDKRHRQVTLDNLRQAYSDEKTEYEIREIARKVFVNIVLQFFETCRFYILPRCELDQYFRYSGLQNIMAAHKKGKGVLIVLSHIGNWELLPHAVLITGLKPSAVYRKLDFAPLDRFIRNHRERLGCKMYPLKQAREGILHELSQNHLVGLLIDQNAKRRHGVFVDFFDRPACASKGLAQLAIATGAPVISMFVIREKEKFLVEFGPEIKTIDTGDFKKDLITNTQNYNRVIEKTIRKYPDQWFWVHRRWKNQPKA